MRKTILLLLIFAFVATACAAPRERPGFNQNARESAGTNSEEHTGTSTPVSSPTPSPTPEPAEVFRSGAVEIFGMYIDDSYRDDENPESVNRLVYLCYSVSADRRPVSVDSRSASIRIEDSDSRKNRKDTDENNENIYPSVRIPGACVWLPDFYYSDYLHEISPGKYVWFAETFLIPADMLSGNKTLKFIKPGLADFDSLYISTDDITWCDNIQQLAAIADPDGYNAESRRRAPADSETAERVRERINGRAWTVQAGGVYYRVAFAAPEHFAFFSGASRDDLTVDEFNTDTLHKQENSGVYQISNGYIICNFPEDSGSPPIYIPYALEFSGPDETLSVDLYGAFDPDK